VGGIVPDYRGLFLRGRGSQVYAQNNGTTVGVTETLHASGQLGQVQGDGSRRITGALVGVESYSTGSLTGGVFYKLTSVNGTMHLEDYSYNDRRVWAFDTSRVVPTAPENRPVNTAVRYLVRARP
jgi:hypothetical protein